MAQCGSARADTGRWFQYSPVSALVLILANVFYKFNVAEFVAMSLKFHYICNML